MGFCVAGKGKSEAHRRMEASRDHGHPELHLHYACMECRFQISVLDGKTAYERRKQKSYRKTLVPFGEMVMFISGQTQGQG